MKTKINIITTRTLFSSQIPDVINIYIFQHFFLAPTRASVPRDGVKLEREIMTVITAALHRD